MTDPADDLAKFLGPAAVNMGRYALRCLLESPGMVRCERVNPWEMVMTWEGGAFVKMPAENWKAIYPLHELEALPWPLAVIATVNEPGFGLCYVLGRKDMKWPQMETKP